MTYNEFIQNILDTRGRFNCGEEYHETHHILPRCLGGTNDKDNLIDLFAREHFIAHKLLTLENPHNEKLAYAWWQMCHCTNDEAEYEVTPYEYEDARQRVSAFLSESRKGENNPFYGKRHTQESKNKMSESHSGENHPLFGKSMPQETKRKIGEANKGKKRSQESRRNISEAHKGKQVGKDNPRAKAVYCEELKEIRLTMKEWAEELGINRSYISFCCSGKVKSAKGYHFRYATEEEIEEYKIKHEYKGSDL